MNERRKEGGQGTEEGERNNCRARERFEQEWRVIKESSRLESLC